MHYFSQLATTSSSQSAARDDALFIIVPLQAPARKNSISGRFARKGEAHGNEGDPETVIEIVLLIPSRDANGGELFAGSRSSERRIKDEREREGESYKRTREKWRKL